MPYKKPIITKINFLPMGVGDSSLIPSELLWGGYLAAGYPSAGRIGLPLHFSPQPIRPVATHGRYSNQF